MPSAPLMFGNQQASGDSPLAGASPFAVNVVVDGKGAVRRRPGISAWSGFPTTIPEASQVDGITSFQGDVYYVTTSRNIYKVNTGAASATSLSTGGASTQLDDFGRPVFAETSFRLVIAGGGLPSKVDSGSAVAARLGGSPPRSTQVIALASRLYTDSLTEAATVGQIPFSDPGDAGNESWDPINFVSAEARPDPIRTLRENSNEAYVWGSTTLQVFTPDPTTILAPGRALNRGTAAPHSVIRVDENFCWLTELRQIVMSDGRSVDVLSAPISATLETFSTVNDCWGFRANIDQFDCTVHVFPTDGRALANQDGGGWAQWQGWSGSGYTALPITAHYLLADETTKTHLVGLATGQIAKLDTSAGTDLGATIKAEAATGFQSFGTDAYKHAQELLLTFKRGVSTTTEPQALLSWRDDFGAYCDPIRLGLGTTGDNVFTIPVRSLGSFRRRDWKMEFTDAADYVLAGAQLNFA